MTKRKRLFKKLEKYWVVLLVLLLIIINFVNKDSLSTKEFIGSLSAALITAIGWLFSIRLNYITFQRSEIIKNKDNLISKLDDFFKNLDEMLEKRATTEDDVEIFVTDKIAEITSKASQIERIFNTKISFISDTMLARLKSEPIDIFNRDHKDIKNKLKSLKKSVLDEIDERYEEWVKHL